LVLTILIENKIFPGFEVHVTYEEFCGTEGTIREYFYKHELKGSFSPFQSLYSSQMKYQETSVSCH